MSTEESPEKSTATSVVKINTIDVPEGAGAELEARFAARMGAVEGTAGFEGFELLRPVAGESRYFVYTRWADARLNPSAHIAAGSANSPSKANTC